MNKNKLLKTKKVVVKKESYHNTFVTKLKIRWKPNTKSKKRYIYNLKNKDCKKTFTNEMNTTKELSKNY